MSALEEGRGGPRIRRHPNVPEVDHAVPNAGRRSATIAAFAMHRHSRKPGTDRRNPEECPASWGDVVEITSLHPDLTTHPAVIASNEELGEATCRRGQQLRFRADFDQLCYRNQGRGEIAETGEAAAAGSASSNSLAPVTEPANESPGKPNRRAAPTMPLI
jgi:hypothetical protein